MKKIKWIWIFLMIFIWSKESYTNGLKKTYYFFDENRVLERGEDNQLIIYSVEKIKKWAGIPPSQNVGPPVIYHLIHFKEKDTSFVKPKSFLKRIEYFNSEWLDVDSHRIDFWEKIKRGHEKTDPLKIYMIEKIKNGDSLKFIRVNRFILWPD